MDYPDFIRAMPALALPLPDSIVTSHAVRSEAGLVVFFHFHLDAEIPPHAHGWQWGTVVEGEVEITIGGIARRHGPGESYQMAPGEVHGVRVRAGTRAIDVFAEPDRYPLRS